MSNKGALPKRDEIDQAYRWDLSTIYESEDCWQSAFDEVLEKGAQLQEFQGKLGKGASELLSCLSLVDDLGVELGKVFVYATMKSHQDVGDEDSKAMADRAMALSVQVSTAMSFIVPEILAIDEDKVWSFLEQEPLLEVYRFHLEDILRRKPHVLSAREEELLAGMGEVAQAPEHIFSMLTNGDMVFPRIKDDRGEEVELSEERYYRLIRSKDREVRKNAFEGIHRTYGSFKNTLAASYGASVKEDAFSARVHRYDSSLDAALDGNRIPVSVYENLLKTVEKGLPLLHRYMSLRKRALGLEELHMYDLYVPIFDEPEVDIPWEEAKSTVKAGLTPLGEKYLSVLSQGLEDRWIDVYENQGKRKGAYSWGSYGTNPFVLLNYNGTLRDVFTLAHEMGHSLHSWHSHKGQPPVYGDYSIFVAEVASTTNEVLLMEHLLKERENERPFLLNYYLEQVRTTVFRQAMFAQFELETHRAVESQEPLTPQSLSSLWGDLNRKYYGPEVVVDGDIEVEWARIPHFYSAFYVYQYATGYSAATVLADRILKEGDRAVQDYIGFLSGGSSMYPIDLLRAAGVDMEESASLHSMLRLFEEKLDELEGFVR
ncbi:oligoendopeptidase F [Dethiosulfovibrio salsuginis]|uniref:Oligopeptidase F n=1 Tax=Dethiosulfovibrio salsuginis TaxID=561720 RepID=A0A1X7IX79_9BACT|nr:oligoendopeptidase F [Dethiosulfovibrio salsuginis]SMG19820.1 oligopeptidase F. Metallo peptidase. MEROPS family M03B [Dethiosulfovibrio salsuginis]